MTAQEKAELFWDLAGPLILKGQADKSTMMGFPCLRTEGKFFASIERETNNLIVKVPAERVNELVERGEGKNFSPNGRVFREWVLFDQADESRWSAYLDEALAFVRAS